MRFPAIRLFFILIILPFGLVIPLCAQENNYINVHFIHGSKPRKAFKHEEQKWRGGIWGGHVGIEIDTDRVIDFKPQGNFHWVAHPNKHNSIFTIYTQDGFWAYFGIQREDLERTTIQIPVSQQQKAMLDSITISYIAQCPYDYAFIGMRCASASYDILMQAGITKKYARIWYCSKYFYPKKLRKYLLQKARVNHWVVISHTGNERRKWDKDWICTYSSIGRRFICSSILCALPQLLPCFLWFSRFSTVFSSVLRCFSVLLGDGADDLQVSDVQPQHLTFSVIVLSFMFK